MKPNRIILILLALMLLIPMAVSCAPKKDELQISDLGVSRYNLVESDGWAYYRNADGLFKIRPNGKGKILVLDKTPYRFQIYEDRIYYTVFKEGTSTYSSIYSCNTDGSDVTFICETEFEAYSIKDMKIFDDWIYFGLEKDEGFGKIYDLYRIRVDGTELTRISQTDEVLLDYSIDEKWIYYLTSRTDEEVYGLQLWRMYTDGTNKQQLTQELSRAIDYTETEIYYIDVDDDDLYTVSLFGLEERKVLELDDMVFFIKVIGDWVYYIKTGENAGFYKIKTDGSDHTKIPVKTLPSYGRMTIVDNWITYIGMDRKYYEMVRISDMHDTDALIDQIIADMPPGIEIRKYE